MICFAHIAKTAGTTMHYSFRENFGINYLEVIRIHELQDQVRLIRALKRFQPGLKGLGGHYVRANNEFAEVAPGALFFTFLRDPVRRFYSWFNGMQRGGSTQDTLEEHCGRELWRNYQTKFIMGCILGRDREFAAGRAELEKAKQALAEDYRFVGLVERYDESLLLMRSMLEIPEFDVRYEQRNVKKSGDALGSLTPEDLELIREANSLDIELYEFARDVLWPSYVGRYQGDLATDTEELRRQNETFRFNRPRPFAYRMVKHGIHRPITALVRRQAPR